MHAGSIDLDLTTWLTAIMLPVLGAMFWMIQGVKKDLQHRLDELARRKIEALFDLREDLAAHKLDVARGYAPLHAIRDIDRRLSLQLVRIEEKLERLGARPTIVAMAERVGEP
jgi:hypothetical protein